MKTLIMMLFISFPSYTQSFMMDMMVSETHADTLIRIDSTKVIWHMDADRKNIFIIWSSPKKSLHFTRRNTYPTRKQRRIIDSLEKKHYEYIEKINKRAHEEHIKVQALYKNKENHLFYVRIVMFNGVHMMITRLDKPTPCYFFGTLKTKL